jgi:hypothetical protein
MTEENGIKGLISPQYISCSGIWRRRPNISCFEFPLSKVGTAFRTFSGLKQMNPKRCRFVTSGTVGIFSIHIIDGIVQPFFKDKRMFFFILQQFYSLLQLLIFSNQVGYFDVFSALSRFRPAVVAPVAMSNPV